MLVGKPVGIYLFGRARSVWRITKMEHKKVGCGGRELRGSNSG